MLLPALLFASALATPQEDPELPTPAEDSWGFALKPYIWTPSLRGDARVGALPLVSLDKRSSELLDDAELGLMLSVEARPPRGDLRFLVDSLYLDLAGGEGALDWDLQLLALEAYLAFPLHDTVELLAGARYVGVDIDVSPSPVSRSRGSHHFADPLVGARGEWVLADPFGLTARADVGGFGVGSELSWQAAALFLWRPSPAVDLGVGWRHLEFDLEDDNLELDVAFAGPVLGFGVRF